MDWKRTKHFSFDESPCMRCECQRTEFLSHGGEQMSPQNSIKLHKQLKIMHKSQCAGQILNLNNIRFLLELLTKFK